MANVYLKNGETFRGENFSFSFHGLDLVSNIEQFFIEKSYLEIKQNYYGNRTFVPFNQIDFIYFD